MYADAMTAKRLLLVMSQAWKTWTGGSDHENLPMYLPPHLPQ